jgi:hypothetical protein
MMDRYSHDAAEPIIVLDPAAIRARASLEAGAD